MEIPWRQSSGNLAYGIGTKKTPDHDLKTYSSMMLHDRNMMLNGNYTREHGEYHVHRAGRNTKIGSTSASARHTNQYGKSHQND